NIYDVFDKLVDEVSFINNNLKTPIRLIFLTDGQPTTGPKKIDKIMNAVSRLVDKNISSLIIGVGEDYNENLLLKIAKTLNGVFEHIDKPESLEKIMYDYIAFTREISARNTKLIIRLNPGFNLVVYNRKYDLKQDGIVVDIGEVNYGELINIVGDIETPPLTIGLAKVGDIQLSYVNPANGRIEVSSPISIEIRVSSREELSAASVSESVLMKSRLIKIASQIEKDIEKGVSKDLIRELENIAEITMKIGDEELASKTISIREKIVESGLTPSLSKEIASIVSRILSGKTRIKRGEESSGEHGE
ncbi:MAG: VWA domain-containing protein, partial [Desulfurococcaceae archaeon]